MKYIENWWETKSHLLIKIEDMETSHIKNTINYLKRHLDFYDITIGSSFDIDDCGYEDNLHLVYKKIEELENELSKRGMRVEE